MTNFQKSSIETQFYGEIIQSYYCMYFFKVYFLVFVISEVFIRLTIYKIPYFQVFSKKYFQKDLPITGT